MSRSHIATVLSPEAVAAYFPSAEKLICRTEPWCVPRVKILEVPVKDAILDETDLLIDASIPYVRFDAFV